MSSSRSFRSKHPALLLGVGLLSAVFLVSVAVIILIPTNEIISEDDFEGVIFSSGSAAEMLRAMLVSERAEEAYWTPNKAQIRELEKRLDLYVEEEVPTLGPWLTTYKRQYFGFIRNNRQLIMVVGFCKPAAVNWHIELVTLPESDGCYFEAQYDAANNNFLYLWEGGEQ